VSFRDLFPQPPEDEPAEEEQEYAAPAWLAPPQAELPAAVPAGLVVGRSDRGVVALSHALVYTTGVQLEFVVRGRGLKQLQTHTIFQTMHGFGADAEPPDSVLRLGLELADGSRVSNMTPRRGLSFEEEPPGPVFHAHGGGGGSSGGGSVSMSPSFWLWPLPPAGPIAIWCEWPLLDVALVSAELDGSALVAATGRVRPLWG
jgi:hypothetical protein